MSQEGSQSTTDEDYESDFSDGSTEVVLFWFIKIVCFNKKWLLVTTKVNITVE